MNPLIDPVKKYIESSGLTAMDYAKSFVKSFTPEQHRRFRKMIERGVNVGENVAAAYGINPAEFNKALKEVLL